MTQYVGSNDGKGPSLSYLEYLGKNFGMDVIARVPKVCKTVVSGSAGVEADIPMGAEIIGVTVVCLKSNGSGTMTVKTNALSPVAITDAIACVTDTAVDYAATIDNDYQVVGANGVAIFGNGAEDYGAVYITYI
jgi:hypothetical protein